MWGQQAPFEEPFLTACGSALHHMGGKSQSLQMKRKQDIKSVFTLKAYD